MWNKAVCLVSLQKRFLFLKICFFKSSIGFGGGREQSSRNAKMLTPRGTVGIRWFRLFRKGLQHTGHVPAGGVPGSFRVLSVTPVCATNNLNSHLKLQAPSHTTTNSSSSSSSASCSPSLPSSQSVQLHRNMATAQQPNQTAWPNTKDDYELKEVIGM